MIGLIWAQARDGDGRPVIGAGNAIPWRVPEDFAHFRRLTSGHPVVMGRLTWQSLPRRPLPGRTNIVVTSTAGLPDAGPVAPGEHVAPAGGSAGAGSPSGSVVVARSLDEALRLAATAPGGDQVWVIGGGRVYAEALPLADRLEVTEIDLVVAGDAFAPALDPARWRVERAREWASSSGPGGLRYRHLTYAPVG